jgi:hypothetical protein
MGRSNQLATRGVGLLGIFDQIFLARSFRQISESPAFFALFLTHIQPKGTPWIHDIFRVKMAFQHSQDIQVPGSNLFFQPGSGLFSNAMMMAHGCTGFLDSL